ncbi:hypothetical protein FHX82_006724 [Amycolatopsis bartoniae]|uniref:Uncharacterized protein n=1 Tax=Amycolatopsis bartoniae TaxID=941986 RepID=A0A8H9IUE0_9PSEU|nr:hypothetical protein [Amycolatopsis bartoniae]MBB2939638.1 hypothetical protein [Amycolatopsis bartoniae]TVT07843.1 hypothetical protein FNH07_15060 [Amycolatopsis bartoniae]GHF39779.1 hypothetical protein GCM10017566_11400 [Amycolatopsis bartoniae]
MTVYEANRGLDAEPDIVLNTAADPARAKAWLTDVLGAGDVRLDTEPPRLRFTWSGGSGELHVDAGGAGASTATLRLDCAGDEDLARRALDALADEVDQNFGAG